MSTNWKSQQGNGKFALQFETDDRNKYELVEKAAQMAIDGKSAADVVEVKHGEWNTTDTPLGMCCVCSVCGSCPTMEYNYCPYCGAKMDGGTK